MWTFHPAVSSLANFNDAILTISMTRPLFTSAVLIKTRINVCYGITAHSLLIFHSEHQVNTESFRVLFTRRCSLSCTHATKETSWFWGCGQFFPFIIKRIFPRSFENKRMHLLTRVYGIHFQNCIHHTFMQHTLVLCNSWLLVGCLRCWFYSEWLWQTLMSWIPLASSVAVEAVEPDQRLLWRIEDTWLFLVG